mgnify:CR=1 FL=1
MRWTCHSAKGRGRLGSRWPRPQPWAAREQLAAAHAAAWVWPWAWGWALAMWVACCLRCRLAWLTQVEGWVVWAWACLGGQAGAGALRRAAPARATTRAAAVGRLGSGAGAAGRCGNGICLVGVPVAAVMSARLQPVCVGSRDRQHQAEG